MTTGDVVIRREGRAGRITLNRPRALNALNLDMVRAIWSALQAWRDDDAVSLVILDGAGERGLCAGGDVISLQKAFVAGDGGVLARTFWREEYRLNALIAHYPKPFVPIMDGLVMGGGIGLSAHARHHRIVTERSRVAFPETSIGLIPDVGGTWLLSRAPQPEGLFLGLFGHAMTGAQAIAMGFADRLVAAARLPELIAALCTETAEVAVIFGLFAERPIGPADQVLPTKLRSVMEAADFWTLRGRLADTDPALLSELEQRSPLALAVTFEAVRRARGLPNLEAALAMEFRLAARLYEAGEFPEGIRALLIDKDRQPRWTQATLADVTADRIEALFAPSAVDDAFEV